MWIARKVFPSACHPFSHRKVGYSCEGAGGVVFSWHRRKALGNWKVWYVTSGLFWQINAVVSCSHCWWIMKKKRGMASVLTIKKSNIALCRLGIIRSEIKWAYRPLSDHRAWRDQLQSSSLYLPTGWMATTLVLKRTNVDAFCTFNLIVVLTMVLNTYASAIGECRDSRFFMVKKSRKKTFIAGPIAGWLLDALASNQCSLMRLFSVLLVPRSGLCVNMARKDLWKIEVGRRPIRWTAASFQTRRPSSGSWCRSDFLYSNNNFGNKGIKRRLECHYAADALNSSIRTWVGALLQTCNRLWWKQLK